MAQKAYIIYLEDNLLLSKKKYNNWLEIQDEYYDKFKTSLGPMTCEEMISIFKDDFGEEINWPFSKSSLLTFFESDEVDVSAKYPV